MAVLKPSSDNPACTCKVTGPDYDQTTWDDDCPYHGKDGLMVAVLSVKPPAPARPITGGLITPCPHCGGDVDAR